ncbi:1,4-alpha-glucan-branching enzyme [Aduncisulcus paluster]|uniref:1,4-alpha-glucan branching enzyme n=1 Tax=Aduncisulcus paluster TaxID=2918883 RepID=A0ABQ5KWE0_9EUKA|nr:1,4-alpha-glucan-branching enzyme [Aduncisulcus paluster]
MSDHSDIDWASRTDGTALIAQDPYLTPYAIFFREWDISFKRLLKQIESDLGGLKNFASSYKTFGFHKVAGGISYCEWGPSLKACSIMGDFNDWNRHEFPCTKDEFGFWKGFVPENPDGSSRIPEYSRIKLAVTLPNGKEDVRLPQYAFCTRQDKGNPQMDALFVDIDRVLGSPSSSLAREPFFARTESKSEDEKKYTVSSDDIDISDLRIYESHVGMACEEERVGSYREFADIVIPKIAKKGYNAVQIMGVAEHSYYASFGYQVTSFFSPASRSGTPDDLKYMINKAHEYGIVVLMDIIQGHASSNVSDGINMWDGSDNAHFFKGVKEGGLHELWNARLFDFGKLETIRFLLSNIYMWTEGYGIDGFRFDAITSILYHHHGIGVGFSGGYHEYFGSDKVNGDAMAYLKLANHLLHSTELFSDGRRRITIAEDVSGMPGLGIAVPQGGLGFDYRLSMAIPDVWIKLLKSVTPRSAGGEFDGKTYGSDTSWKLGHIVHILTNRRWQEKVITYCESHDQALVGDKTLAFWLMDKDMYTHMTILTEPSALVSRGIALHKVIRVLTMGLGGEGFLCFMGNEFGHPEWIDFPREGNGWSHAYCRRQWSLEDDGLLRYKHLGDFDRKLMWLDVEHNFMKQREHVLVKNEGDMVVAWTKGELLFVVSFHPDRAFTGYGIPVLKHGKYVSILHSDEIEFGGIGGRLSVGSEHFSEEIHGQVAMTHSLCSGLSYRSRTYFNNKDNYLLTAGGNSPPVKT